MRIYVAQSDDDVRRCFPVMSQLRPDVEASDFLPRVRRQEAEGYLLAAVEVDGEVVAVAGFRMNEMLSRGRFMYVDDLVTDEACRSKGYGDALFEWLVARAREEGCRHIDLDSGVQRHGAHRFYFRKGMQIMGYHFTMAV